MARNAHLIHIKKVLTDSAFAARLWITHVRQPAYSYRNELTGFEEAAFTDW